MSDANPYVYALGTGVGGALAFIGKWVVNLVSSVLAKAEARGDRLETKLFETQELIYPAVESASTAIREAIAIIAATKEG